MIEPDLSPDPNESTALLIQALEEIKSLRYRLKIAEARLQMFDDIMTLLRTPVCGNYVNEIPDLARKINDYLQRIHNP